MESAHPSEMLSLSQVSHSTSRDLIPAKPQLSHKASSESSTDILHVKVGSTWILAWGRDCLR